MNKFIWPPSVWLLRWWARRLSIAATYVEETVLLNRWGLRISSGTLRLGGRAEDKER